MASDKNLNIYNRDFFYEKEDRADQVAQVVGAQVQFPQVPVSCAFYS